MVADEKSRGGSFKIIKRKVGATGKIPVFTIFFIEGEK
jgi:hypothetical protein